MECAWRTADGSVRLSWRACMVAGKTKQLSPERHTKGRLQGLEL